MEEFAEHILGPIIVLIIILLMTAAIIYMTQKEQSNKKEFLKDKTDEQKALIQDYEIAKTTYFKRKAKK